MIGVLLRATIGLATLSTLVGCSTPKADWKLEPISDVSVKYYDSAHRRYWESCAKDDQTLARRQSLDMTARELRAATQSDNHCPLFHSKLGDVLLEWGEPSTAKAEFEYSLDLCGDWVPGWIGLAEWATRQSGRDNKKLDEAEHYLKQAEAAITRIEDYYKNKKPTGAGLGAIGLFGQRPEKEKPSTDPSLAKDEQFGLLVGWMVVNEGWLDSSKRWQVASVSAAEAEFKPLVRRLRARIWYLRSVVATEKKEPADHILTSTLEESRKFDPNYIPTQRARGEKMAELNDWQSAESLLRPLKDNELFANNLELWRALAILYAEWYRAEPSDDRFERGEEAFEHALDLNVNDVGAWVKRGQLDYAAGHARLTADPPMARRFLEAAAQCADKALTLHPQHPDALALKQLVAADLGRAGGG